MISQPEAVTDSTKRPTSAAKIESNRRNSQRSTGPRTQQGKEVSRLNGMTHGACSKIAVLPGEDPEARSRRLEAWLDALGAETEPEIYLVENAVDASCCIDRARRAEDAALTRKVLHVEESFDDTQAAQVAGLVAGLTLQPAAVVRK